MRRLHLPVSICLLLVAASSSLAQQSALRSRLLQSASPEQNKSAAAAAKSSPEHTAPTRLQPRWPARKAEVNRRTAPRRNGTVRADRPPTDSPARATPARRPATTTRKTLATQLQEFDVTSPYDLSGSRRYLVAAAQNGRGLVLCDLVNERRLRLLAGSGRGYALVKISRDARWIAAVRRDDPNRIDVWRADNGRQVATLAAPGGAKRKLAFSPRGDELHVTLGGGRGQVFSIPAGKLVGGFGAGGSAAQRPTVTAPRPTPRVGAAPRRRMTSEAQAGSAPTTKRYAIPQAAGPEPSPEEPAAELYPAPQATVQSPAAAAPVPVPLQPAESLPTAKGPAPAARPPAASPIVEPQPAAPQRADRKQTPSDKSASKYAAPSRPQPAATPVPIAAPEPTAAPTPAEPAMPQPRAAMADDDDHGGSEPPAAAASSSIFDKVADSLSAEPSDATVEDGPASETAPSPEFDALSSSPEGVAAERPADAPAAPGNSLLGPAAESTPEAAPPAEEEDRSGVTVHFATNRNRLAAADREWTVYFKHFFSTLPAFVIYALVVLAVLIFPWFGKRRWATYALAAGVVVLCAMGGLEAYVRSQLRDELTGELYGSRPVDLSYGVCEVSVPLPENREAGELNRPVSVWVFEAPANPEKHFMLRQVTEHENQEEFFASLSNEFDQQGVPAAMLFIHGYNVSFEDAVFRTAQLAVDLEFQGAPILYSWPSYAEPVKYTFDEQNAEVSIPAFRQFLKDLAAKSGAERIHVIAHSMGNRVLAGALEKMDPASQERNKQVFREVVLAAPDIDRRVFESQVLPHIRENAHHCTLYASSRDRALLISHYFHNYQRLGETEPELVVAEGMDTIDASFVDTSLLGHSYIGDVQSIVSDLHHLVVQGKRPMDRLGLETLERGGLPYWSIKPLLEAATAAPPRR